MAIIAKLKNGASTKDEIDKLLKIFKKKIKQSGILKEVHDRMYYDKPSKKKREKRLLGKHRARKQNEENNA